MIRNEASGAQADRVALLARWWPLLALELLLALIAIITSALDAASLTQAVLEAMVKIVAVVGLYLFIGNSGIMSFGHVGFMAIGAYAAAWQTCCEMLKPIVMPALPDFLLHNTFAAFPAAVMAGLLAGIVAVPIGAVVLRLNGVAASIASFAVLFIVNNVYSNTDRLTQGVGSIVGLPMYLDPWICAGWAGFAVLIAFVHQRSRSGLCLRAAREDEAAAQAAGIRTYRHRLLAFVLSAFLLGVSGALYGSFLGTISVDTFFLEMTFTLIAMLVVGGVRSLAGAVVGVLVVSAFIEVLRRLQEGIVAGTTTFAVPAGLQGILLALFLLLVLMFRRDGLMRGREFEWSGSWSRPSLNRQGGRGDRPASGAEAGNIAKKG